MRKRLQGNDKRKASGSGMECADSAGMRTIQDRVNDSLSNLYNQPVVAGYTNSGWPVVRPANDPDGVVYGGMGNPISPLAADILAAQSNLISLLYELDRELDRSSVPSD